jgi:periplasmic protein TonB
MPSSPASPRAVAARLAGALAAALLMCAANAADSPAPSAGPRYYRTSELDVHPGIKVRIHPEYPAAAARRGLSGKVVIRLYINEKGGVDRVETLRAQPPGVFESSAERAFRAARFAPGMKDKHAVKTQMTIEVNYESPPPAPSGGPR